MDAIWLMALFHAVSYGLLLFLISAGFSLVYGWMGVLNFAHVGFYVLGAYVGHAVNAHWGLAWALLLAPLAVGMLGAAFEWGVLSRLHARGHMTELLVTYGLALVLTEGVQLVWGRAPLPFELPPAWQAPLLALGQVDGVSVWQWGEAASVGCGPLLAQGWHSCATLPASRVLVGLAALVSLGALWVMVRVTPWGLWVRAAASQPRALASLGHDLRMLWAITFGVGAWLAGLAGVVGGAVFVTEPDMASQVGALMFVVVVLGGVGRLGGGLVAALALGGGQTAAIWWGGAWAQWAAVLPFAALLAVLAWRQWRAQARPDRGAGAVL